MQHEDHVALIRAGVLGAGPRWLELGAGDGAFTLALADVLGPGGRVTALDRDEGALRSLGRRLRDRFPATDVEVATADFTTTLPAGPFDGTLAANSLHFIADPVPVLRAIRGRLAPGGRLVVVEYDAERGNRWVPYPIAASRLPPLAQASGFTAPTVLHRVPSRFLGSIYGAVATAT